MLHNSTAGRQSAGRQASRPLQRRAGVHLSRLSVRQARVGQSDCPPLALSLATCHRAAPPPAVADRLHRPAGGCPLRAPDRKPGHERDWPEPLAQHGPGACPRHARHTKHRPAALRQGTPTGVAVARLRFRPDTEEQGAQALRGARQHRWATLRQGFRTSEGPAWRPAAPAGTARRRHDDSRH